MDIEQEYKDFLYSPIINLKEYQIVEKLEDLFNNYNPLIISEDVETGTYLIRKKLTFNGKESYVYRLIKTTGTTTLPTIKFTSQYQCQIWNQMLIEYLNDKITKESIKNTIKLLAGLITYSEFMKKRDEIGDDSDYSFRL